MLFGRSCQMVILFASVTYTTLHFTYNKKNDNSMSKSENLVVLKPVKPTWEDRRGDLNPKQIKENLIDFGSKSKRLQIIQAITRDLDLTKYCEYHG